MKILKNQPLPKKREKYPFPDMVVGDCLEVIGEREVKNLRNAAYQYHLRDRKRFAYTTRWVKSEMKNGKAVKVFRLWRTK